MAFEFLYNGFATGGGGGGGGAEGATAVALNSVGATIVQNLPSTYNSINNTITVYYDGASATIVQKGMVTTAAQSFAGAKTFTSALAVSAAASQLVLGSTANTTTFNSPTSLTATRTVTLPDANSNTVRPLGSATSGSAVSFIDSTGLQTLTNTITNANNLSAGGTNTVVYQSAAGTTAYVAANATGTPKYLQQTSSGTPIFAEITDSGVTSIGTLGSGSSSANGASISGSTLYMQPADSFFPGIVTTGTQQITGEKTFLQPVAIENSSTTDLLTVVHLGVETTNDYGIALQQGGSGIGSGASMGSLMWQANNTVTVKTGAQITAFSDTPWSGSNHSCFLNFYTTPTGGSNPLLAATLDAAQRFNYFYQSRFQAASNQVAIGSTSNTTVLNSPTSLTASRTVTFPDANSNTVRPLGSATAGSVVSFIDSTGLQTLTNTITNATLAASATALATPRAIYGNDFDGTVALTQVITSTYGGTGNGFTKFTGATATEKTYTLPNASSTLATTIGSTTWVPTDGSAAVLTLTINSATYSIVGNLLYFQADITYPVTATTNPARISLSGLPYASSAVVKPGSLLSNNSVVTQLYIQNTSAEFATASNNSVQNAALSGLRVYISGIYII